MYSSLVLTLAVGLISLCSRVAAQEQEENYFINPPTPGATHQYAENNVFAVGSTINLQWTTDFETLSLVLWQNDNSTYETILNQVPYVQTLRWQVDLQSLGFNLNDSALSTPNVFFFELWQITNLDTGDIGKRFSSHYFNITSGSSSSGATSTSTSDTVASSRASAPADATNTAHSSSAISTTSNSVNTDSGLSTGSKIGIGVGVGVGVACLLIGAAGGFFLRRRRDRLRKTGYSQAPNQLHGDHMQEAAGTPIWTPHGHSITPGGWSTSRNMSFKQLPQTPPAELSTDQYPRELPTSHK